jgi:hypothetical protein
MISAAIFVREIPGLLAVIRFTSAALLLKVNTYRQHHSDMHKYQALDDDEDSLGTQDNEAVLNTGFPDKKNCENSSLSPDSTHLDKR